MSVVLCKENCDFSDIIVTLEQVYEDTHSHMEEIIVKATILNNYHRPNVLQTAAAILQNCMQALFFPSLLCGVSPLYFNDEFLCQLLPIASVIVF